MTSSNLPPKRAAESVTESVQVVMPNHLNGAGRIFGGQLVAWIDVIGGIARAPPLRMRRHDGPRSTTCSSASRSMSTKVVVLRARVTFVGRTSMEVRVDTFVEERVRHAQARQYGVSDGIALGADGHPHARAAASV